MNCAPLYPHHHLCQSFHPFFKFNSLDMFPVLLVYYMSCVPTDVIGEGGGRDGEGEGW